MTCDDIPRPDKVDVLDWEYTLPSGSVKSLRHLTELDLHALSQTALEACRIAEAATYASLQMALEDAGPNVITVEQLGDDDFDEAMWGRIGDPVEIS